MNNQKFVEIFDEKFAASYDKRTKEWAAGRHALFSMMSLILGELPAEARVLCVGAGTGTETMALAEAFPQWHFTLVEPAPAMLAVCREKAEASGVSERCAFHGGFLDSLPNCEPFDAATCLLVSHFFAEPAARSGFFREIAGRLRVGGILINSDLVLGVDTKVYDNLLSVWMRMMKGSGYTTEEMEKMRGVYQREVAAFTPEEIEGMLEAGGFETPSLFFQTLLIRAWFSRRAA